MAIKEGTLLWEPSSSMKEQAHLTHYMHWLGEKKGLHFKDNEELEKVMSNLPLSFKLARDCNSFVASPQMCGGRLVGANAIDIRSVRSRTHSGSIFRFGYRSRFFACHG